MINDDGQAFVKEAAKCREMLVVGKRVKGKKIFWPLCPDASVVHCCWHDYVQQRAAQIRWARIWGYKPGAASRKDSLYPTPNAGDAVAHCCAGDDEIAVDSGFRNLA
jgi:hypothetical protein